MRAESPEDILAVRRVHAESFATPPGAAEPIEAPLLDRLRADGAVLSALTFVAVRDGEVVGSVVCSRGRIGERPSVGLGPIAVLPSHQRQGIGSALMAAVIDAAQVAGERAMPCSEIRRITPGSVSSRPLSSASRAPARGANTSKPGP